MTRPTCDGLGIVVVGSAVTPGSYESDIQNFLNAHPGASYLRTDQSCPSLNQATSEGNPIYAAYTVAGYDEVSVRAAVCSAGDGAYGKWLDTTTDPSFQIKC
jgi:serine/threonine-protein kinase